MNKKGTFWQAMFSWTYVGWINPIGEGMVLGLFWWAVIGLPLLVLAFVLGWL